MNIFEILDGNDLYRETFVISQYQPMPEEVLGWNDSLQELFCVLSVAHQGAGMNVEEADETALRQVRQSEWFALWSNRQAINGMSILGWPL